ncbi:hypothetical protein ACS0PU_002677 [Formica fusca]
MWVWRRMLRIPWTARRTNISVLNEIKLKQRLSSMTYSRILRLFGHIARHDNMEKLVQGKPEGKHKHGRSPTRWTDLATKATNLNLASATRVANNRDVWRSTIHGVIRDMEERRT